MVDETSNRTVGWRGERLATLLGPLRLSVPAGRSEAQCLRSPLEGSCLLQECVSCRHHVTTPKETSR